MAPKINQPIQFKRWSNW